MTGVILSSGTLSITGGTFSGNVHGVDLHSMGGATIDGGTFSSNRESDIYEASTRLTVRGGSFNSALMFFQVAGTIDIYGTFSGMTPGATLTLPSGVGTFTGTLQDNSASQAYSYDNHLGGTAILHDVPEPATLALLALGLPMIRRSRRV